MSTLAEKTLSKEQAKTLHKEQEKTLRKEQEKKHREKKKNLREEQEKTLREEQAKTRSEEQANICLEKKDAQDKQAALQVTEATLEHQKSTKQEIQPNLLTFDVKVCVYAYTLPGRGVGMTKQHAKEEIGVKLVIWQSQSNTSHTPVMHEKICENIEIEIKAKAIKDVRPILQCLKQARGIFGFWISPVCFLRWVIYNHKDIDIDHHFLAYSEDSTDRFTTSELKLLLKCFNEVHPYNKCTLLV